MAITTEKFDQIVVVRPDERIDTVTAPNVERTLITALAEGNHCVVDMSGVTYISSAGLGAFVKSAKRAGECGRRIAITGLAGEPKHVFEATNLHLFFELFPSREEAIAVLNAAVKIDETNGASASNPRNAAETTAEPTMSVPEEILLLAIDPEDGRYIDLPPHSLDHALAGAVLMELSLRGKIDLDLKRLECVDPSFVGDELLDPVINAISQSEQHRSAQHWIRTLVRDAKEIERRVISRLISRNVLEREASGFRRVFRGHRHPLAEDKSQREVKDRLLGVITSNEIPLPRDIVLIALAEACAVFDSILDEDAMMNARQRILEIAGMDLMALSMLEVLVGVQREGDQEPPELTIFSRSDAQPAH